MHLIFIKKFVEIIIKNKYINITLFINSLCTHTNDKVNIILFLKNYQKLYLFPFTICNYININILIKIHLLFFVFF